MNGSGQMVIRVFAFFPDVDQQKVVAPVEPGLHVVDADFADTLANSFDELQKNQGNVGVP